MKLLLLFSIVIETFIAVQVLEHVILIFIALASLRTRPVYTPGQFILLVVVLGKLTFSQQLAVHHILLLSTRALPKVVLVITHIYKLLIFFLILNSNYLPFS